MRYFRFLFSALVVLVAGLMIQGARVIFRQCEELRSLKKRAEDLEKQIADQHRQRDATSVDLGAAERQLATSPDASSPNTTDAERAVDAEVGAWLTRVKKLKQLFADRPDQSIPEMRLLTNDEWLQAARNCTLDTEEKIRRALADMRDAAKGHLSRLWTDASHNYAKATKGERPASIAALAPYFRDPADAELLNRYAIVDAFPPQEGRPGWALEERAPVDADYDTRYAFPASGGYTSSNAGPLGWIPNFDERTMLAFQKYAAAHKGEDPPSPAAVLPYFDPPLDPALVERFAKLQQSKH